MIEAPDGKGLEGGPIHCLRFVAPSDSQATAAVAIRTTSPAITATGQYCIASAWLRPGAARGTVTCTKATAAATTTVRVARPVILRNPTGGGVPPEGFPHQNPTSPPTRW